MEEGSAAASDSVSRSQAGVYLLNEVAKICAQFFRLLFIFVGIATMNTSNENRESLLMKVLIFALVLYYFALVIATILQFHVRSFIPLIMLTLSVGLAGVVSVLALMMISPTIAWIVLPLWLLIFALMGYYFYHQELYQVIPERIKKLIEDYGGMSTHNSMLSPTETELQIGDPQF